MLNSKLYRLYYIILKQSTNSDYFIKLSFMRNIVASVAFSHSTEENVLTRRMPVKGDEGREFVFSHVIAISLCQFLDGENNGTPLMNGIVGSS